MVRSRVHVNGPDEGDRIDSVSRIVHFVSTYNNLVIAYNSAIIKRNIGIERK